MIKPASREPIMLSRCRKRANQNANPLLFAQNTSQQAHINLQVFQQSLTLHPSRNCQQQYGLSQRDPQLQNKKGAIQNSIGGQDKAVSSGKSNFNRIMYGSVGSTQTQKSSPINENNLIYSLHQAKASFKPVASNTLEKENAILVQPQLTQLKARAISSVNRKADILREIKKAENSIASSQVKEKENQIIKNQQLVREQCLKGECISKNQYQAVIKIMNEEKNSHKIKVQQLQEKLSQRKGLQTRVQQIQKQLLDLCQQNQQLQQLNEQIFKQDGSHEHKLPVMVRDSFCQTYSTLRPEIEVKISEDMFDQDWINRAHQWKFELQKERLSAINRQIQFKTSIENLQIESRHKVQKLQRQLQQLSERYQSKCNEVKERQLIISKYLFNK